MESTEEVVSLLKSLTQRFDSLQKDVDVLKEKEARRSASDAESEPSGRETDTVEDAPDSASRAHERHASTSRATDERQLRVFRLASVCCSD